MAMEGASSATMAAPAPAAATATPPAAARGAGIDTTRVLNLFGYVGPVASLMTHTLFPRDSAGGTPRSAHIQRMPGIGAPQHADGRLHARAASGAGALGGAAGGTRFVLSRTEDAMDSVLPCAAERMFRRPGKFSNPSNLRFDYSHA